MSLWQIVGVSVTISDTGDLRSRDLLLILIYQVNDAIPFGLYSLGVNGQLLIMATKTDGIHTMPGLYIFLVNSPLGSEERRLVDLIMAVYCIPYELYT